MDFDQRTAFRVAPDLKAMLARSLGMGWLLRQTMDAAPLRDDAVRVGEVHRQVGGAMPDRDRRPRPVMAGGAAQQRLQRLVRRPAMAAHAVERFRDRGCGTIRQAGDDCATGEDFGIGGKHHRRHGAAGRKAGDEDAAAIDAMRDDHRLDHLADRQRFAGVAADVFGHEPVEAEIGVVGALLLGEEHGEPMQIGKSRPAGTLVVSRGGLGAAVQDDDQRRVVGEVRRRIDPRPQHARVCSEFRQVRQAIGAFGHTALRHWELVRAQAPDRIGDVSHEMVPWRAVAGAALTRGNARIWGSLLHCTINMRDGRMTPAGFFPDRRNNALPAPLGDSGNHARPQGIAYGQIIQSGGQVGDDP